MGPDVESSLAVTRLFGRAPSVEDLRCVGRWSYAAAWLARDRATARDLVRARLRLAASAATAAAVSAGRGDADRFGLVSALARLAGAIDGAKGALSNPVERAVEEGATILLRDGATLRAATQRERSARAGRVCLETFEAGLYDVGQERHVLLREASAPLDEALRTDKGECPALQAMRLFLSATLATEPHEAFSLSSSANFREKDVVTAYGAWLMADVALSARRASAYEASWSLAFRASEDALSRALSCLASGTMRSRGIAEAFAEDPWALPLTLAMTSEAEHASAVLDFGVLAHAQKRIEAKRALTGWATEAERLVKVEKALNFPVLTSSDLREASQEAPNAEGLDLFSLWHLTRTAEEAQQALRSSIEKTLIGQAASRREAVRRAKLALDRLRQDYENELDAQRERSEAPIDLPPSLLQAEAGAQRGCFYGVGVAGCVLASYAALTLLRGSEGAIGRLAPLVLGVAALPVAAAITVQMALTIRRSAAHSEIRRVRKKASDAYSRARTEVETRYRVLLGTSREALAQAEANLAALEKNASKLAL